MSEKGRPSDVVFERGDIEDWTKHFRLESPKFNGFLSDLGITLEDSADLLLEVFKEDSYIYQIQVILNPAEFESLKMAVKSTKSFLGQSLSPLLSDTGMENQVLRDPVLDPKNPANGRIRWRSAASKFEECCRHIRAARTEGRIALSTRIDRSGSMDGVKMTAVKLGLCAMLANLADDDIVDIGSFSDRIESMSGGFRLARDLMPQLPQLLEELKVGGGTACYDATMAAIDSLRLRTAGDADGFKRVVVILTDGSDQDSDATAQMVRDNLGAPQMSSFMFILVGVDLLAADEVHFSEWMQLRHCKEVRVDVNTGSTLVDVFKDKLLTRILHTHVDDARFYDEDDDVGSEGGRSSRAASVCVSATNARSERWYLRDCVISPEEPDWAHLSIDTIHYYSISPPSSIRELVDADIDYPVVATDPLVTHVKVADFSFSRGGLRSASRGQEVSAEGTFVSSTVIKETLSTKVEDLSRDAYESDLAAHRAAFFLAHQFNKIAAKNGISLIRFVNASVCQNVTRRGRPWFIQEALIEGKWEKYNSNSGYVEPNPSLKAGVDHSAVQAYSHWTYVATNGKIMVVDCQGCFDGSTNSFVLTDPAVHCTDVTRFNRTNLGSEGHRRFFSTHRCNDHCRTLQLSSSAYTSGYYSGHASGTGTGLSKPMMGLRYVDEIDQAEQVSAIATAAVDSSHLLLPPGSSASPTAFQGLKSAAPAGAGSKDFVATWDCAICTFINKSHHIECEMCDTPKRASDALPSGPLSTTAPPPPKISAPTGVQHVQDSDNSGFLNRLLTTNFTDTAAPLSPLKGLFTGLASGSHSPLRLRDAVAPVLQALSRGSGFGQGSTVAGPNSEARESLELSVEVALDAAHHDRKTHSHLSLDEIAIIKLYTMEVSPRSHSFYFAANQALRARDREIVKPYVQSIWLLLTALKKCPAPAGPIVFRGVKGDLSAIYEKDLPVTWTAFTSCTRSMSVLSNDAFLGYSGPRTMFTIELSLSSAIGGGGSSSRARVVSDLSMVDGEDEVLLAPNSRFVVVSVLGPSADGRLDVQLREVAPLDPILNFA